MDRRALDEVALSVIWDPMMTVLGITTHEAFITYKTFVYGLLTKPSS